MARLFGTDGVRGIANVELNVGLAYRLGKYGARVLRARHAQGNAVLIGHDGRISADMLSAALAAGFCSEGLDVYLAGELPTPGIATLTRINDYALGVVVSASHNAFQYNGIKFFDHAGYKLPDSVEDEISSYINGETADVNEPLQGAAIGRIYQLERAGEMYLDFLLHKMRPSGHGLRVALDCANGATQQMADRLFQAVGCEITARFGCDGNGTNINDGCGSTHPQKLAQAVKASGADVGFAFDGDGDRLICIDREGRVVNGDAVMAILAMFLKNRGELSNNTLVATVMSNLGLHKFCAEQDINLVTTQVGDRYVLEEMLSNKYSLGGEQSGHIILRDYQTTGDGLLSALALIAALDELELDLADADKIMSIFPQVNRGISIPNTIKNEAAADPEIRTKELEWMEKLADRGRIVLRASGTEPLVRVMVEAENEDMAKAVCDSLCDILVRKYPSV